MRTINLRYKLMILPVSFYTDSGFKFFHPPTHINLFDSCNFYKNHELFRSLYLLRP